MGPAHPSGMQRLFAAGCLALVVSAAAAEPTPGDELERMHARVDELREQVRPDVAQPALWQELIQLRYQLWGFERRQAGETPTDEAGQEYLGSLVGEWLTAQPDSPDAHLYAVQLNPDPEGRMPDLLDLTDRYPQSEAVHHAALWALRQEGDTARMQGLVEAFLQRNPDSSFAFESAYRFYDDLGQAERGEQLLAEWLASRPGDPAALGALLSRDRMRGTVDEHLPAYAIAVERVEPSQAGVAWCRRLGGEVLAELQELGLRCLRRLVGEGLDAETEIAAAVGVTSILTRAGRENEARPLLELLPAEQQARVLGSVAVERAADGDCASAMVALRQLPQQVPRAEGGSIGSVYASCAGDPVIRRELEATAADFDGATLRSFLSSQYEEPEDVASLVGLSVRRLEAAPDDGSLWYAVDALLAKWGTADDRLAFLERWLELAPDHLRHQGLERLVETLTGSGRVDEAIERYETELASSGFPDDPYRLARLGRLYLDAGRLDSAETMAVRILEVAEEEDERRLAAHRLLAEIAWSSGDTSAAYEHLREVVRRSSADEPETLAQYALLAGELDRLGEVAESLERRWQTLHVAQGVGGRKEEWVADRLAEVGLLAESLTYLERVVGEGPADKYLWQKVGRVAAQLGEPERAEEAWRMVLALDPRDGNPYWELARLEGAKGDLRGARAIARRGLEVSTRPPAGLRMTIAETYRSEGRTLDAIRELRILVEEQPRNYRVHEVLKDLYVELAEDEGGGG